MNKLLNSVAISIILAPIVSYATVDPSTLVKVQANSNIKCVEYYYYQNELYCSTTAQNKKPVDVHIKDYETQKIIFDDRPWQAVWGQQTPTISTVEYVPMGDDIENWTELVTSQFIPGLKDKTPKEYFELVQQSMKDSGFKPVMKIIDETPNQIIFEFRIDKPANQKQDEIQKVMKGPNGFYLLHYVIKKSDMGDKSRATWLDNIKKSTVK